MTETYLSAMTFPALELIHTNDLTVLSTGVPLDFKTFSQADGSAPVELSATDLGEELLDAYLLKPVRSSRLLDAIRSMTPAPKGENLSMPREQEPRASQNLPISRLRILVAEDNIVNQKVVLAQLRKLGFTADIAANGLEALAALVKIGYDVILMDCQMPEMDGYQASRAIRTLEQRIPGRHTQIIALTANAIESDRQRCLHAGMDDYLAKPVKIAALEALLHRLATVRAA